jgi:hypothetical protein
MKLAPLIVKFAKVTMNGSQKMSAVGWDKLREAVCSTNSSCKLRKLELKIAKNDDDVIRWTIWGRLFFGVGGQQPLVPLLLLGPPFFQIILFGSTTLFNRDD